MAKSRAHHSSQQSSDSESQKTNAPLIVNRVGQIPLVHLAVTTGVTQYDKLKGSNATVNDVISNAERFASYLWSSVQPVVTKLHDPIEKVDQIACKTLDYVEANVPAIKKSPEELWGEGKTKYTQVVEQSTIIKFIKSVAEALYAAVPDVVKPVLNQFGCQQSTSQSSSSQPQQSHQAPQQHQEASHSADH